MAFFVYDGNDMSGEEEVVEKDGLSTGSVPDDGICLCRGIPVLIKKSLMRKG